ncbi:Serine phosphatase RsbU, regulator of sigma subunit [Actinacidiphila glaucinigra]|uniref:Serine phosphatase RsbU, regulator of sigma subunit n=2 Tax=Actinacidiphila glaucinigra TaxID=235986 RepID=A0A239LBI5_9ACTN|nr:Serine phosphatase RsbU, regulator of sigma subunit [Actinacidiphila glaucinigra]
MPDLLGSRTVGPDSMPREFVSRTSLPGNQLAASAARKFVRAALAEWTTEEPWPAESIGDDLVDDAVLLVSELVTNAVIHAGTTVELLCRLESTAPGGREEGGLVVEVSDHHPARVVRDRAELAREGRDGGRGLQLVSALSEEWGITYRRELKTIWCRLAADREPAGTLPPAPEADRALLRGLRATEILAPTAHRLPRRHDSEWINRGSLSFLAEASDLLAGQLDEDMVASLAGQLLVPRLADWCAVWLSGDGPEGSEPRLARVWHASESRIDGLRMVLEKEPPPPASRAGAVPWPWPATAEGADAVGAALACPLVTGGRWHGTLLLGRTGLMRFPDEVIGLIEDFARRVALAVGTARQYTRQAMISRVLQRGLLPAGLGAVPGVDTAVVYEPTRADVVGGDFYDLFPAGGGRWCFALGDVQGNGPEAAAVTGLARPVMRLLAREGYGVTEVLDRLNRALADEAAAATLGDALGPGWDTGPRFLSLLYGEIVPEGAGEGAPGGALCTLASAGHPLPLLLTGDGAVRPAAVPQILLGITDDARYRSESFRLAPGDTLLCVTDGVTERRNGSRQFDDDDGLAAVLAACAGLGAAGVAERIRRAVHEYDVAPPDDDLAVLVLQAQ